MHPGCGTKEGIPMKPSVFLIAETSQARALAAPTRQEILDTLESSGPATVATLGALLDRAPDSLYHHIRILRRAGLIHRTESVQGTTVRGAVYDLPARSMRIAYELRDPAMGSAICAVARAMTRISYLDFKRALTKGEAVVEGPGRNLRSTRKKAWLDSTQIEEINRHFQAIVDIMSTPHPPSSKAKVHAVTFMISPVESRPDTTSDPGREKGTGRRMP
jgi:DNA-binding transcriptional ArsR family regulator